MRIARQASMHRSAKALLAAMLAWAAAAGAGCSHESAQGRQWVHRFAVAGNRHFSSSELTSGLATQQTGWWPFASKQWFDPAALDGDVQRVKAFYAERGFFKAHVVDREVIDRGNGSVDVRMVVDEGPPAKITSLERRGLDDLSGKDKSTVTKHLQLKQGDIFDYGRYVHDKLSLTNKLKESGYAFAKVSGDVAVDRDQDTAEVDLDARTGPHVRFGKIRFEGNGNIPAHALKNRVSFREGDPYDPDAINTTQGRLYDLGVFSSVRLSLPEEPDPNADIVIHVRPGKLHELRFGAGVGVERARSEVRAKAQWTSNNFLGGLRKLRIRVTPAFVMLPNPWNSQESGVAAENDIQLTQPDIFNSAVTAHALAGYDLGIQEGYQFYGPRAQLGADRPLWRDHVLLGVSWNLQYLTFFNINSAVFNPATTPLGLGFVNPYRLGYLEETVTIDLRDRPLDARRGFYALVRVEQGGSIVGGQFDYFKITPEARAYLPLGRRLVLAARGLVGWLYPSGSEDSPITRRYNLGGPSSHRGFSIGRLSPEVRDPVSGQLIPIGGDGEFLLSGEARIEAFRLYGNWVGFVPFIDLGDVTPKVRQLDFTDPHIAVGGDLTYATPVGALRAGLGVRLNRVGLLGPNGLPNPDPGDRLAFHITIGEAF
jgi:translocation and assembly module TamA